MVVIKPLQRVNPKDINAERKFYAAAISQGMVDFERLAYLVSHQCTVRESDCLAVLRALEHNVMDELKQGKIVQLGGPLSIADSCEIIRKIAVALAYTDSQGFVHRDVKPSNIMLSRTGEVKLLDLGLARFQFSEPDHPEITGTGQTMGTADYVAPEQVTDSRSVDIRADVYSLGCTLMKLLTGFAPFADVFCA